MLVDLRIAEASGTAERRVALEMIDDNLPGERRMTLGADKGYHNGAQRRSSAGCDADCTLPGFRSSFSSRVGPAQHAEVEMTHRPQAV